MDSGSQHALIVVDVQNDFASPRGSLYVAGGEEIIEPINAEIDRVVAAGGAVLLTQDWHPPETPHFSDFGGTWPVHCVRDTWGAALVDELAKPGPVVRKGTGGEDGYSGFTMRDPTTGAEAPTELDGLLRRASITEVTVVGLALDVCVKATALDAISNGYRVTVIADQTRAVDLEPGDGRRALVEMADAGATIL